MGGAGVGLGIRRGRNISILTQGDYASANLFGFVRFLAGFRLTADASS